MRLRSERAIEWSGGIRSETWVGPVLKRRRGETRETVAVPCFVSICEPEDAAPRPLDSAPGPGSRLGRAGPGDWTNRHRGNPCRLPRRDRATGGPLGGDETVAGNPENTIPGKVIPGGRRASDRSAHLEPRSVNPTSSTRSRRARTASIAMFYMRASVSRVHVEST